MMTTLHESKNYSFKYDSAYGVGLFHRKRDGAQTLLEMGSDCDQLRRDLNRLKSKTSGKKYPSAAPGFDHVFDAIASEYTFTR